MSDGAARAAFFEQAPLPLAIVGFDGVVQDANHAWRTATGWPREELVGRPLQELLHAEDLAARGGPDAVRRGALAGAWEARCRRRDGSAVQLAWEVAASPAQETYVCVARPLADEERRRLERFQADFLNLAAHELNTPLTPIQLALDTLHMRLDPVMGRDLRQSVEIVQRSFRRLRDLVAEILDAARLHAGRLSLEMGEADLSALVQQAVEAQGEAAAEARVTLRTRIEPGLRARADPARLLEALGNFLASALACASTGGEVEAAAARQDGQARVAVTCRGAGLTLSQCEALFLPFQPGDDAAAPPRATGLGLYMARGIVELHGGQVAAAAGERGDLTLSFALPLEGAILPQPALPAALEQGPRPA